MLAGHLRRRLDGVFFSVEGRLRDVDIDLPMVRPPEEWEEHSYLTRACTATRWFSLYWAS